MVVLSQPVVETLSLIKTSKRNAVVFEGIPVVDVKAPNAKTQIVKASQEFGFFKVVNHGVAMGVVGELEAEAVRFFGSPQSEKDRAGPPNPFGYGFKRIGPNGDVGWIEYLLLATNPNLVSPQSAFSFPRNSQTFWSVVEEYVREVRNMGCEVLELMADGLKTKPRNAFSRLLRDERSDSCLRLNHYPPCPEHRRATGGRNLIGFGEHTDPQLISIARSNDASGLQIALRDGTWVSVPPDPLSFFINVGDSLQVMTNGRFRSVRHRVVAESMRSRVSMIYFGGPPLSEKIAPLPSLMEEGEESLYEEFTWCEFKNSAYKSRLGDNRLKHFERKICPHLL